MQKRSVSISGHRTSVSLEPEFWAALEEIAAARGLTPGKLIAEIDRARMKSQESQPRNLASAVRVYVLRVAKTGGDAN